MPVDADCMQGAVGALPQRVHGVVRDLDIHIMLVLKKWVKTRRARVMKCFVENIFSLEQHYPVEIEYNPHVFKILGGLH